MKVDFIALLLM